MDLHAWITQQVHRAEFAGRRITLVPDDGSRAISGTVTDISHGPDGVNLSVAQYGAEPAVDATLLRRCEADRRILARHKIDPDCLAWAACKGCGNDDWGLPNVDNINDCPELLDLAHAHGITPEILTGLDQPQIPEPKRPADRYTNGGTLTPGTVITTSDVPEALRGPRWKP